MNLLMQSLPALFWGAITSIEIGVVSALIGFAGGVFLAWAQRGKYHLPATLFITIIRGTPMLVQILFIFFVLPQVGLAMPPLISVMLAIGLNSSAFLSKVIESGIRSIPKGQLDAAKTLGLTPFQTYRFILLPQAIRTTLPALGNECVTLVKDSSLASVIGVVELTKQGSVIRSSSYDPFTILLAVGAIYLLLTAIVDGGFHLLQRRFVCSK